LKKYALISVSEKTGAVELSRDLNSLEYQIIATGNTFKLLQQNQIDCIEIKNFTGFPEIFSGRVKTLHPKIFGGILMRRDNESDCDEAELNNITQIDIVCVNLYPFPQVVNREDISLEEKIENIDIGGPSLIRAAAKNYQFVSVLTNPLQYPGFIEELKNGGISSETRSRLAFEAFSYTSYYDTLIANFLEKKFNYPKTAIRLNYDAAFDLRYGENPHQKAYVFGNFKDYFDIIHGKELSYNNIVDLTAAVELINDLPANSCAIIKHTNPCGAAVGQNALNAYERALSCDPASAFGGIVVFNNEIDEELAIKLNELFLEIICAPAYSEKALNLLMIKKNRRLIRIKKSLPKDEMQIKSVPGGLLIQEKDNSMVENSSLRLVTSRTYTEKEFEDMKFAWVICKHTKSNAIIYVKDKKTVGVGAGQMSRVDSAKIAASKANQFGQELTGAVAASDAYFPFTDGLLEIAAHGITAIIQPGGSVRDEEVIKAANDNNISMVFTGIRNFKH
jgi:phosphoribosylaminoimidazolecarboxamide formyltransferase/IMP cyclohydrolase